MASITLTPRSAPLYQMIVIQTYVSKRFFFVARASREISRFWRALDMASAMLALGLAFSHTIYNVMIKMYFEK